MPGRYAGTFQDLIVFNPRIKKTAGWVLTRYAVVENPLYNCLYLKRMKHQMEKGGIRPSLVRIENTNICNADCVFCPHSSMRRRKGTMDMGLYRRIVDKVRAMEVPRVVLHGFGEPLLDGDFLKRVEYADRVGIPFISTNTNAAFLNERTIRGILSSALREVYISFDAATPEAYEKIRPGLDFHRVERNINRLIRRRSKKQAYPKIYLSYVQCDQNRDETEMFISKWRKKVDGISISLLHNWSSRLNFGSQLKRTAHKRRDPCRSLWSHMDVNWQGNVILCCYDYESQVVIGDLGRETINDIWNGPALTRYRNLHLNGRFEEIPLCKGCNANYHHRAPWWLSG